MLQVIDLKGGYYPGLEAGNILKSCFTLVRVVPICTIKRPEVFAKSNRLFSQRSLSLHWANLPSKIASNLAVFVEMEE